MALQTQHGREDAGIWFVAILVGGIILVMTVLLLVVAIWGHFAAPDPGAT